jgi:hypothetical protein
VQVSNAIQTHVPLNESIVMKRKDIDDTKTGTTRQLVDYSTRSKSIQVRMY